MAGRADVVQLLHDESDKLKLNIRTQMGPASTPLHLAAERGHVECVVTLIECGASLEAVDRRCRTAKEVAAENGKRQVVHSITLFGALLISTAKHSFIPRLPYCKRRKAGGSLGTRLAKHRFIPNAVEGISVYLCQDIE